MTTPNTGVRNPYLALATVALGLFVSVLDTTIVNVALPDLVTDLGGGIDLSLWVVNGYLLAMTVLYLTGGRLGDLIGSRRMFVAGMVVFTVTSVLCGLSATGGQLIAARTAQGIGAAMLAPQVIVLSVQLFPPQRRGTALGIIAAVASLAAVLGPFLGGVLVEWLGWRAVFAVNVPIGIATIVLTLLTISAHPPRERPRFDVTGLLLATIGLTLFAFALIEGERYRWGTVWGPVSIPLLLVAGVVLLVGFVASQRRPYSLIPRSLTRIPTFVAMNGVNTAAQFALLSMYLPLTLYIQAALRLSPIQAGLALLLLPTASGVAAPLAGRLTDRYGGRPVLLAGLLLSAAATLVLIATNLLFPPSAVTIQPALVLSGIGLGFTFAPSNALAMRDVTPTTAGAASGVLNTTRLLGNILAAAIVGALLQIQLTRYLRTEAAVTVGQLPPPQRQAFLDAVTGTPDGSLLPNDAGITDPALAATVRDTFAAAFGDALRIALLPGTAALLLVALWTALATRTPGGGIGTGSESPSPGESAH